MKIVDGWTVPDTDTKVSRWVKTVPGDVAAAMKIMEPHLSGHRTCIQAGGHIGSWPLLLALHFDKVLTVEPDPVNYECLLTNTVKAPNVTAFHAALGCDDGFVGLDRDDGESGNCGAYYVTDSGDIPNKRIDSLALNDVDLIYLDIEGSEYNALIGAYETIIRCHPVIGLEEKFSNKGVNLLCDKFGYKVIGKPSKLDVLLAYE